MNQYSTIFIIQDCLLSVKYINQMSTSLQDLKAQVAKKQEQLDELRTKIQKAIDYSQQNDEKYDMERMKMLRKTEVVTDAMQCVKEEYNTMKDDIREELHNYWSHVQKSLQEIAVRMQTDFQNKKLSHQQKIQKKQQQNKKEQQTIIEQQKIIKQQKQQIAFLKNKLSSNVDFVLEHCQFAIKDHQSPEINAQPAEYLQHPNCEQQSDEYPRLFFEGQNESDQICQISQQMAEYSQSAREQKQERNRQKQVNRSGCINNQIRLERNKKNQNNKNSENAGRILEENKNYVRENSQKFWRDMGNHIPRASTMSLCNTENMGHRAKNKSKAVNKQKQVLMSKINDFRQMLFLDKGISRFGIQL